jgi:hypothetical protein
MDFVNNKNGKPEILTKVAEIQKVVLMLRIINLVYTNTKFLLGVRGMEFFTWFKYCKFEFQLSENNNDFLQFDISIIRNMSILLI